MPLAGSGSPRGAILKAIRRGKLSAAKNGQGQWRIDPAELTRAYGVAAPPAPSPADTGTPDVRERMARAEAMVEVLERQVGDLQRRLDEAERERRELQGKALALIEDRREGPSWWRRWWRS
jgi:hypothetical protein